VAGVVTRMRITAAAVAGGAGEQCRGIGEKDHAGCGRHVRKMGRLRVQPVKSKKSFEIRLRIFPTTHNRKINKNK
jgi:hypothetical protein